VKNTQQPPPIQNDTGHSFLS